jgi:pilus assembly protein CpaF
MFKDTYTAIINVYTTDIDKYNLIFDVQNGKKTKEDFKKHVLDFLNEYYPDETEKDAVVSTLIENLFGYSIIEPLLRDDAISDIKIYDWQTILYKEKGEYKQSNIAFESEEHYTRFVDAIKSRNRINASTANAISKFADNDTSENFVLRFTLIHKILVQEESTVVVIRKFRKRPYTTEELLEMEVMPPEIAEYLEGAWDRGSLLVCGAPSGGKSTILNWLKEFIPTSRATLVIQEADELTRYNNNNMLFLHKVDGSKESDSGYNLADLTIAGLTLDVSYCLIGEIKGKEARYLMNASYTGLTCGGTIHSNCAENAVDKIVDYSLMGDSSYTKKELLEMLSSFKTIIFMKNFKVSEIDEIVGFNTETGRMEYSPIYRFSPAQAKE